MGHVEARESFKAEALASWAEYQETGLHLTGEEVARWLDSWPSRPEAAILAMLKNKD
ncbi:putative transcriptional regulator [Sphingobium wenxiniae]|uniref:Uncharacterized protein n=1 Tax=Sphingobium wenxiniae (strain DSM 21828 / CGMCC 1.7748 / JZ-1) TaxID=595605 RepID=A0A562JP71_SPHWJ|nr:transcriptional regulator [Sphingobium wenxiniae]MBB6193824.1 putative transcriptional regulator [Sphingobium wenxiniae]TWH84928.1 hypothetical protein IQ35_04128 [Sphingobium wenxiniae]SCW95897.1 hypothetical protein SAMN02927924_04785 [Sphingobium faniae]